MRQSPKRPPRPCGALRKARPFVSPRKRDRIALLVERLEDRLTPAATVNGTVFLDFNANGVYDTTATMRAVSKKIQLKKMLKPSTVTEPWKPVRSVKPLAVKNLC